MITIVAPVAQWWNSHLHHGRPRYDSLQTQQVSSHTASDPCVKMTLPARPQETTPVCPMCQVALEGLTIRSTFSALIPTYSLVSLDHQCVCLDITDKLCYAISVSSVVCMHNSISFYS